MLRASHVRSLVQKSFNTRRNISSLLIPGVVSATLTALPAAWASLNYMICKPNQYLVKTGVGIRDIEVSKSSVRWPFQNAQMIDVNPTTYAFRLHNMSKGKVEFMLPIVMTVGPSLPEKDPEAFGRYCKLLQDMTRSEIEATVRGIIEGETRGLTAQLTVEEMFNGKDKFRETVIEKLAPDLAELGVVIYNANIQEMRDYDDKNKYFEYRKQRAIEIASNEARRDVAEAQKQGDIDVSERVRDTRINVAQNEKDVKVAEYARRKEILEAESIVAQQEAETKKIREQSLVKATQNVEIERQKLQQKVEEERFSQMKNHERTQHLAPAIAQAESMERLAEATLYSKSKEAEGIQKVLEAKAEGVKKLVQSCGDSELARFYLGVDTGLWHKVAEESAKAVHNMKPQITQWTTGSENGGMSKAITDLAQGCVPIYEQIQKRLSSGK